MHEWVVSFDLNSLYPHLIMQYNISPEMYAGQMPGEINFDTSPTDGQFLSYDATSSKWVPATSAAQASVTRTAITFAVALGGL
jgi:DNA polymerase elongation subunit (family B)